MATATGLQSNLGNFLQSLIELEHDTVQAYEAAVKRLESRDARQRLATFCEEHQRHIAELTRHAEALDAATPSGPDAKAVVTQGKVLLGALVSDEAILRAMLSNEQDTNTAYERAMQRDDLSEALRETLARNLSDEHHHRHHLCAALGIEDEGQRDNKEDNIRHGAEPRTLAAAQPLGQTTDV